MTPLQRSFVWALALMLPFYGCTQTAEAPSSGTPLSGIPIDTSLYNSARWILVRLSGNDQILHQKAQTPDTTTTQYEKYIISRINSDTVNRTSDTLSSYYYNSHDSYPTPPYYREDETHQTESNFLRVSLGPNNTLTGRSKWTKTDWGQNHWGIVYSDERLSTDLRFHGVPCVAQIGDTLVFRASGSSLASMVDAVLSESLHMASSQDYRRFDSLVAVLWDTAPTAELVIKIYK